MVVVNGMKPFWLMTSLGVYAGSMGKSTGVEVRIVIMYLRPRNQANASPAPRGLRGPPGPGDSEAEFHLTKTAQNCNMKGQLTESFGKV